jgi:hypothetical protein
MTSSTFINLLFEISCETGREVSNKMCRCHAMCGLCRKHIETSKERDSVNVIVISGCSTLAITIRPLKSHFKEVKIALKRHSSPDSHLIKHYAMKTFGNIYVHPRFLDLGTSWRRVVSFTPRPLYPQGKNPQYPLDRLGGPKNRLGRREEEKILDPTGTRTPTSLSSSPLSVVIPTALSRLLVLLEVRLKITPVIFILQFDFQFPKLKNQHCGHADFFRRTGINAIHCKAQMEELLEIFWLMNHHIYTWEILCCND